MTVGNPTHPKSPARLGNSPRTGQWGVVALSPGPTARKPGRYRISRIEESGRVDLAPFSV
jgi:hypothetical protein